MSAPDIFALGGRQDADAEILALFREWCAAWRACSEASSNATDEEMEVALNAAEEIAERIYDAPVQGIVGLAIKAFMVGEGERNNNLDPVTGGDPCALGAFADSAYSARHVHGEWTGFAFLYSGQHALRGLLASAAAFVPELQPLVAKAVASPLTLPPDDDVAAGAAA
jgi:hypothetical protein